MRHVYSRSFLKVLFEFKTTAGVVVDCIPASSFKFGETAEIRRHLFCFLNNIVRTVTIRMLCFVIISSLLFNLLCVWILLL